MGLPACGPNLPDAENIKAIEISASMILIPVVTDSRKHDMLMTIYPLKEIGTICSDIIVR
jgi:hypothetical protein